MNGTQSTRSDLRFLTLLPLLQVRRTHVMTATARADRPNVVAALSRPSKRWISMHFRFFVSLRVGLPVALVTSKMLMQ